MALFPRLVTNEFAPMFRLLDDYATHMVSRGGPSALSHVRRTFQPKFDVKEHKDAYELHGELPGIKQKDISIEFIDPQTLSIKGRTETQYEVAEPATEETQSEAATGDESSSSANYRKPSVEEVGVTPGGVVDVESPPNTQVAERPSAEGQQVGQAQKQQGPRFWLSERSVGEFSRTFAFPTRVDQERVKASLKDGILSIIVPKASAPSPKRINIEE